MKRALEATIIQFGILLFWTFFWLLNIIDKFIGGYTFLWVGKDRFAQIDKFFASIGAINHEYALYALLLITILEIIAFIFLAAALANFCIKHIDRARTLFFYGTLTGLVIFSIFSIGDQIFGDRFELLEHSIFWISIIISWGAFVLFPQHSLIERVGELWHNRKQEFAVIVVISVVLSVFAIAVIVKDVYQGIRYEQHIVTPVELGEGVYRFNIPFSARRSVWEESLTSFIATHPTLRITDIQTIPNELKSKKDNAIFFVITETR